MGKAKTPTIAGTRRDDARPNSPHSSDIGTGLRFPKLEATITEPSAPWLAFLQNLFPYLEAVYKARNSPKVSASGKPKRRFAKSIERNQPSAEAFSSGMSADAAKCRLGEGIGGLMPLSTLLTIQPPSAFKAVPMGRCLPSGAGARGLQRAALCQWEYSRGRPQEAGAAACTRRR